MANINAMTATDIDETEALVVDGPSADGSVAGVLSEGPDGDGTNGLGGVKSILGATREKKIENLLPIQLLFVTWSGRRISTTTKRSIKTTKKTIVLSNSLFKEKKKKVETIELFSVYTSNHC